MTTIPHLVERNAEQFGDLPALTLAERTLSWRQTRDEIARIATGLDKIGVRRGDRVAIMMPSTPEHWLADQAAAHLGAMPTTVYGTTPSNQIGYIVDHADAQVIILDGPEQMGAWAPVIADRPQIRRVIIVDPDMPLPDDPRFMRWSELVAVDADIDWFRQTWQATAPSDPVTLIYTSGTTGMPKGVVLTHQNVIANAEARNEAAPTPLHFRGICYLPLAHIAERMVSVYMAIHSAGHVTFCPDASALVPTMVATRPTSFFGVPRIWEKLASALRTLPDATLETVGLGDTVWACSAAAPLSSDVQEFFAGLGLPILEAWGMTEATGVATSTSADNLRIGSVGLPIPGTELRLAEDGEVLIRGPIVAAGYLQADGSLQPVTDTDGWMHTGDIGRFDETGQLYIVDRKKDLIITAGGKNIAPVAVETLLTRHPLIGQALAYGDRRPYVVALIVLDPETAPGWARKQGIEFDTLEELVYRPEVIEEIDNAVEAANAELARVEQVKRYRLLGSEWTSATGELTPSMKVKRRVVHEMYDSHIQELYEA